MDQHAIDIVVTDSDGAVKAHSVQKHKVWKQIYEKLQDNRLSGRQDADRILDCENPEKYKCLKTVLNIAFLAIGVALLIAVIAVIIYSCIDMLMDNIVTYTSTVTSRKTLNSTLLSRDHQNHSLKMDLPIPQRSCSATKKLV